MVTIISPNGVGCYIKKHDTITNWCISDVHYHDIIEIGVKSTELYRRKGLSIAAVAATINECFQKGYSIVQWQCVDFNKGSRAIAEKLGFQLETIYTDFSSYPPCENQLDLSPADWTDWAEYFAACTVTEPRLLGEQLLAYLKANDDTKAKRTLTEIHFKFNQGVRFEWIKRLPKMIEYYHKLGMCSEISKSEWETLLAKMHF
ncbi:MAG: GNAT family N-acetyltransferase [Lachnospiraceae bacterium]